MKRKTLLLVVATFSLLYVNAQQKTTKPITGYAITAQQKGQMSWKEVKLVDFITGEELKPVYQSTSEPEILNARTGNPVVKKNNTVSSVPVKKVVNLDQELDKANGHVFIVRNDLQNWQSQTDKPFATNSAALAYDKKHDRLYYTPMGINQLRYIDLKSGKIYYFENESFGIVTGPGDAANQIPRMAMASDGNGYGLSNNCDHLVQFTTGKKPTITDLGALTDDVSNGNFSVRSQRNFGGDIIADASHNLYLIGGNRSVYKISIETKVATYLGSIKGLPQGFTTNGAMVEEGSKVIVCSSQSPLGYFRFDLVTLQAEKVSTGESVFNASDLANGNLAFEKQKKDKKETPVVQEVKEMETTAEKQQPAIETIEKNTITVYPNPVTSGLVKISFANQPAGKYQLQFMDISGKLISSKDIIVNNEVQVEEFRLPQFITSGNYLLKIASQDNKVSVINKLTVQ